MTDLTSVIEQPPVIVTTLAVGQGPRGPAGPGASFRFVEHLAAQDGVQHITIPVDFDPDALALFVNGLLYPLDSFTLSGSVVTVPVETEILAGYFLAVQYVLA